MRLNSIALLTLLFFVGSCTGKESVGDSLITIDKRIFDGAKMLKEDEKEKIFRLIKDLETKVGSQIAIITLDTLSGESINDFSLEMAQKLNLGRSKFDDGLLLTFSLGDMAMRIEVGYGLEKIITDEISARIIREDIVPKFRKNDFGAGIYLAVDKIKSLIEDNLELVGKRP